MHPRQEIRNALASSLSSEFPAFNHYVERSIPRSSDLLPSIAIFSRSEELVSQSTLKQTRDVRSVNVQIAVTRKIDENTTEKAEIEAVENTIWTIEGLLRSDSTVDEKALALEFQQMAINSDLQNSPSTVQGVLSYNFNIAPFYP